MPCAVSDAEIEDYNRRHYGLSMTDGRMLTYLLCQACKQIEEFGLQVENPHVRYWWEQHKKEDAVRNP